MSSLIEIMDTADNAVRNVLDTVALLRDLASAAGPGNNITLSAESLATVLGQQCDQLGTALQALDSVRGFLFPRPA